MSIPQVTPRQLKTALTAFIANRIPVLISGAPGIGKTDIFTQAAADANADLLLSHPVTADPTDAKGLPWASEGAKEATFLPFGDLAQAIKAKKPLVWGLDDLGQSSPAVQASFMQLILARRINGHKLPDCVTFIAATNRRVDRAGVTGILEPVKSRFGTILELVPTIDDWCDWAYANGMPGTLIAFLRFRPTLLSDFQPTADLTNSPSPRTWANLARVEALGLPDAVEAAAMSGAVGQAGATEYRQFRILVNNLQNLDAILLDPKKAAVPTQPNILYATAVGLASRATVVNFPKIAIYAEKLVDAGKAEFAVLMIRDATSRDKKLQHTPTFTQMASSKLGDLFTGNIRN